MKKYFFPSQKSLFVVLTAVSVLAVAIAAFFSWQIACITAALAAIQIRLCALYLHQQNQKLIDISDCIDEILHGEEILFQTDYQEGGLNILQSEIQKMTISMREKNILLRNSQLFMKESLENISHQLRTPLTSMMLLVNLLSKSSLTNEKRMEYVQELANLNARMQWLIETLLKISRMDAGVVKFQQESVSCQDMISAAIQPLSISAELKDIRLTTQIEKNAAYLGDAERSVEAVSNILKNCIEHTEQGGEIHIEASNNPLFTQILITDSGKGIAESDLPHIFERFYRSSDFAKNGYGIGLAFAQQIVRGQNGSLTVRNVSPQGAQFDLRFYHTVV